MGLTRIPLGTTGLEVARLGFGGAVIGIPDYLTAGRRDDAGFLDQARAALIRAFDAGVNLFDTAPGYGGGRSEEVYGEALDGRREDIVLATKVGVAPGDSPERWWASVRDSLIRLRTDHVDLLQLHGNTWDDEQAVWVLDEVVPWLREVRGAGLTRFVGITAEAPSGGLEDLIRSGAFDTLQIAYSVIYQDPCDHQRAPFGVIPLARAAGMGVLTMRTTTSGVLRKLLHAEFPDLAAERIARLAINFVLSTPEIDCALVGMNTVAEVDANVALAADDEARIDVDALHYRFV